MKRSVFIVLAMIATPVLADLADEVRCREIGFSQSVEYRDIDAFRSFLDADARFISNRPRRGAEEVTEGWSGFMAADGPRIRWRPQFVEVLEDGTLAFSVGIYEYTGKAEDGSELRRYGSFHSTWRLNDDGAWRVVFDAGNQWSREPTEEEIAVLDQEVDCGD